MTLGVAWQRNAPSLALLLSVTPALANCSENAVLELFPASCPSGGCGLGGSAGDSETVTATGGGATTTTLGTSGGTGGGGTTSVDGCGPLAGRVRTTRLVLPAGAVSSDEYNPVVLAPRQDNSSLLAYRESGAERIRVLTLDTSDQVTSTMFEMAGREAHALLAHADGGALVVVREDPDIFSPEFCRPTQPEPCNSLDLVRFDANGDVRMSTALTDKLSVEQEGALFMYWYEHTARIAWAEDTYGIYFRSARTIPTPMGLVPRPGDTLRFVDAAGNRLDRGWDFGCEPSWSVRIQHNQVWAAVCHGQNPNAHRVVILEGEDQRELLLLEGVPPAYRALGGFTPHGDDFWLSYLERSGNLVELHLARVTSTPAIDSDTIITEATDLDFSSSYLFRAYHGQLGSDLLLGWQTNEELVLLRADSETGAVLEGPLVADATIDRFVEFTPFPNGDLGWAHSNASGEVTVTRVLACPP